MVARVVAVTLASRVLARSRMILRTAGSPILSINRDVVNNSFTIEDPNSLSGVFASALFKDRDGALLIDHLQSFYKKDAPPERELVDVNELVREMLPLLRTEAERHSISLRTDLAAELPKVTADRVQLQQVLMNLMINAIDANFYFTLSVNTQVPQ